MYQLHYLFLAGLALPWGSYSNPITKSYTHQDPVITLYQSNNTFVENQQALPNGHVLISTVASGNVYTLNPYAPKPTLKKVISLPGGTAVFGLTSLGHGLYAATSGNFVQSRFALLDPYLHVFKLDGTLVDSIPGPGPADALLNGITALPNKPHVVLSSDSNGGKIFRFDTKARSVSVAVDDPALKGSNDPTVELPLGVNGIKIRDGYLYFTNTYQGTYGRFKIDANGNKVGKVQILVQLELPTGWARCFDDFIFDHQGNAYIAQHYNSILKVTPKGVASLLPGTGQPDSKTRAPTSIGLAKDGKSIYVTTATTNLTGTFYGGGVFKAKIH